MERSAPRWLVAGLALAASVSFYYFGFVRHGKATLSPAKVAAQARRAIAEGNVEIRRQAAWDLALSPDGNNRAALEKALEDKDAEVRHTAILGLGWLKDPNSAAALTRASKDKDTSARQDAAWALGRLPEHRGYEALAALVRDSDTSVVKAAALALGELAYPGAGEALTPNALPYFAIEDGLNALVRLKAPGALDAVEAVAGQDLEMALKFAARIEGCGGVPFIVSTAATRNDYKVDQTAITNLAESNQPCVGDALVQLSHRDAPIRRQVVKFLVELGGPTALSEIRRLQHDADPITARMAAEGLAHSFGQQMLSVPDIMAQAQSSNDAGFTKLDRHLSRARVLRTLVGAGLTSPGGHLKWLEQARADVIVPELLAHLSLDKNTWRRQSVIQSLVDESALPALAEAAKSPDPRLREFIAETLLGMTSSNAQSLQLVLTADPELKVRVVSLKGYRISAKQAAEARIHTMLTSDQPADIEAAYAASRYNPSPETFSRALEDIGSSDAIRKAWASSLLSTVHDEQLLQLIRQIKAAPELRLTLLEILKNGRIFDASVISRHDIIPIVASTLADPDARVSQAMACLLSEIKTPLRAPIEAEYRRLGASASLGKLLAAETEAIRECAKGALLLIGDERGLATLLDKERTAYDWSEVPNRLRGKVTVALAKKVIRSLAGDDNTPQTELIAMLSTAPASVVGQTYVPLLCNRSAQEHAHFLSVAATWGIPTNLAQLPEGSARECLKTFVRNAFALGNEDAGIRDEQRVAIGIVEQLGDKSLVDALFEFAQKLQPDYLGDVALRTLANLGDPRALPIILRELSSSKPRNSLVTALASYDDTRVLSGLLSAFTNVELREVSVEGLVERLPKEQWVMLADLATNNCKDSYCASSVWKYRSQVRLAAPEDKLAFRLREPSYINDNLPLLAVPLSSNALITVVSALSTQVEVPSSLYGFNHPASVDSLKMALKHLNSRVRVNAIRVLTAWKAPGILELIAAALNDNIADVRVAAAEALGKLEDARALPYLGDFIATWETTSSEFGAGLCAWASLRKDEAAKALGTYTSPGYLSHNVDSVIPRVIRALGCSHSELAVAPLVSHLERYDSNAWQVIDALGENQTPAAAQVLVKILSKGQRSEGLLKALARFKSPGNLTALIAELDQSTTFAVGYLSKLTYVIASYKEERAIQALIQKLTRANCDDAGFYMAALTSTHDETVRVPIEQTGVRCHTNVKRWIRELHAE